jgi:hypothetical protein
MTIKPDEGAEWSGLDAGPGNVQLSLDTYPVSYILSNGVFKSTCTDYTVENWRFHKVEIFVEHR